jgi:hypothetical protein
MRNPRKATGEGDDVMTFETPENPAANPQTKAVRRAAVAQPSRAMCEAVNKDGSPCRARPLSGTRLCNAHTPGLAAAYGVLSGRARRRPPLPMYDEPATLAQPQDGSPPEIAGMKEPMTAQQLRLYVEKCTRLAVGGRLNKDLANLAVRAAVPWLRLIEAADHETRLAAIEKALGIKKDGSK